MANPFIMTREAMKSFDFSPWGGIEGFLEASKLNGGNMTMLKRSVPDLARALDMTATAVASLPFNIVKEKGEGEETDVFDTSTDWQNKLGGMPNPARTLYLLASSLCGGAAYLIPTRTPKLIIDLQYAAPQTIQPYIDYNGLQYFDRNTEQGKVERYDPDDIIYFWLPDSDVEIGPAQNTPLSNAHLPAALIYSMENTMRNYGERGFVPLTLLGVKGMVAEPERSKMENFFNRLLNFGFREKAKVINADAVEVVRVGAGMDELKGSYIEIRRAAEEGIADAFGIPTALFMSDNAYASEFVELRKHWYSDSRFVSLYQTIQEVMTDQLYKAYGYKLRFALETLDIFQADESKRALSLQSFVQAVTTDPQVAQLGMGILGYDLTDEQDKQLEEIIKAKEEKEAELQKQMQQGLVDASGKPVRPANNMEKVGAEDREARDKDRPQTEKKPPRRKALDAKDAAALVTWEKKAITWFQKSNGEKTGADWITELPEDIADPIRERLTNAKTEGDIRRAFVIEVTETPAPVYQPPTVMHNDEAIKALAAAIDKASVAQPPAPQTFHISVPVNVPETTVTVTPEVKADAPMITVQPPEVNVTVAAPSVSVTNDVQPAEVTVIKEGKKSAVVKRDGNGNITGLEAK